MQRLSLPFLICAWLSLRLCAAGPASTGEWRVSLDGPWSFSTNAAAEAVSWDPINVPGNWDVLPKYSTHKGRGWYRRTFTVPPEWKGMRIRLHFDAVYHEATVTLNGRELGGHTGGYTPFEFDVTDVVRFQEENTVTVCADNTYRRGAWWAWGGISRSVNLVANHDVRIVRQHIHAEPDLEKGTADVVVRYRIGNSGATDRKVRLSAVFGAGVAGPEPAEFTLPAGRETFFDLPARIPAGPDALWHFDHPVLHALTTTISEDGRVLHAKTDRFGVRKVAVTPEGLFLNGEKIRVAGFNRVNDSREFGNTEPDALVRRDVDLMKRAGAVFARLMHNPQAPNLLDYLDEKGMMIFAEIPVWGEGDPQVEADSPLARQWLREMIERDYNHPCIIGWSPGNELQRHHEYVRSMLAYIRRDLDPHRLAAYVSYTGARSGVGPGNDPITFGDIAMINVYNGKPEGFSRVAATLRERWPDKPVFFSEFGVAQIGADPAATIPNGDAIWASFSRAPYVIGGALWTFNDYRSDYKGTPASGNREWGVVDEQRRPKAAYEQVRNWYRPVRSFDLVGGSAVIQPRGPDEIPGYTLRGYVVRYVLRDRAGVEAGRGEIPVPVLKPGDPAWTARVPGAREGLSVELFLLTPTGYEVCETKTPVLKH